MTIREWPGDGITIKIDYDKCKGHSECIDNCPADVYELQNEKAVPVAIEGCVQCCTCVSVCPEQAIEHSACS